MNVHEFMEKTNNITIVNAIAKTWDMLGRFYRPLCSISGGSDSDIMLDMIYKLDEDKKMRYIWFNTGLEWQASKRHLDLLEKKYSIKIERVNVIKSIPQCCKEYGQPFLSKRISQYIYSLQKHGFNFSDMKYEKMLRKYPKTYVDWWHNKSTFKDRNVNRFKFLKEFLIANPPNFRISHKCCYYAKKRTAWKFNADNNIDLECVGLRQAEGGVRSAHTQCVFNTPDYTAFWPIFWFTDKDKKEYCETFNITHSECYTKYGLKRTGCIGCPFNRNVFSDLERCRNYEAGLVEAASNVFKDAHQYTKLYRDFIKKQES